MQLATVSSPATPAPMDKAHLGLKKAAQQFESYFLDSMFKEMRKTVPKDTLLGDDAHEKDTFQEMIDQHVAESISNRGDFGLASMLYNQLSPTLSSPSISGEKTPKNTGETPKGPEAVIDIRR